MVVLTTDPLTCKPMQPPVYCTTPGGRLYYRNEKNGNLPDSAPVDGNICVNKRDNPLPKYVVDSNNAAHTAIGAYLQQNNFRSAPWQYYKLVNVQYFPYDKDIKIITPNGSPEATLNWLPWQGLGCHGSQGQIPGRPPNRAAVGS